MSGGTQLSPLEERVLVLASLPRDAELTTNLLAREGLRAEACTEGAVLRREIARGAATAILAEESLDEATARGLREMLEQQPFWSDLPFVVFVLSGSRIGGLFDALGPVGNVTVLERPVRISTLVSAVQVALRARRRQYEVRDLVSQLKQSDEKKDEFLAMLGHELRNPLGAIRNALEVLAHPEGTDDLRATSRAQIDRQLERLVRMVDDLLNLARITQGKISLHVVPLELNDVVRRAVESFRGDSPNASATISITLRDTPLPVRGDSVRLEQVLHNLLQNAVKYTEADGSIDVEVVEVGDEAEVRVRDDGIGIATDQLEQIFDPFFQVERTLVRSRGGLGLGLPLVKRLVSLHGGTIQAYSDGPGLGSEFRLRLPLAGTAEADAPVRVEEATGPRGAVEGSVLVVEDQRDSRESLCELLRLWGYPVESADDGQRAVDSLLRGGYRLALIDIGLPGLDGYEVARRVRESLGRQVWLVAMTGYGQEDDRKRALAAGFDEHLVKPVAPRRLSRMLAAALGQPAAGSGASD